VQRIPSWPGVIDSIKGRIHLRRPTCHPHFSLATGRRTIHLHRHIPPLTRRYMSYFCSDAHTPGGSFVRLARHPEITASRLKVSYYPNLHSLDSDHMLNRGYAYTTIISSKYQGQTLLFHLASLYPHSSPQAWQQKLDNGEVTLNSIAATGSELVTSGQTVVWNRPPWIEPDSSRHFEVLFDDPHLLAVNKPSGLPTLPGAGFMENTLLRLVQKQTPNANPVHRLGRATSGIVLFAKTPQAASKLSANWNTSRI